MSKTFTEKQIAAIETRGRVLVSAAAGSGKTTAMLEKILNLIGSGVPLKRTLILVYNNAGADELKERLYGGLFERACGSSGDVRTLYRDALDELPFARVGTIHGFCQTLIRENFDKLDISPVFSVLDESRHAAYMRRALDSVFAGYAAENDEKFASLSEIFSYGRKEDNLRDTIIKLYGYIDIQPDKGSFFNKVKACYYSAFDGVFADVILKTEQRAMKTAARECAEIVEPLRVLGEAAYAENVVSVCVAAEKAAQATGLKELLTVASQGIDKHNAKRKANAEADVVYWTERAKSVIKFVDGRLKELADALADKEYIAKSHAQNAEYAFKLIEIAERFSAELGALKRKDSVLSFSDLEHYAVELVKDGYVGKDLFDYVFVDEYQDVNPTQEYIISALTGDDCFFVGDVKQSIYGFRMADPTIFLRRENEYKNGGGTDIGFTKNFRSDKNILNFVNGIFDEVMTTDSADVDYRRDARFDTDDNLVGHNVQMHFFIAEHTATDRVNGIYNIGEESSETAVETASESEGAFIAEEIKALVGRAVGNDGKKIGYSDVAVLFRSRNEATMKIISAVKAAGIPVDDGKFGTPETTINELTSLLKSVDNPRDDIAFAGYLLSYFGEFEESEVAEIASLDGKCLYDKFKQSVVLGDVSDVLKDKINVTLETLEHYRRKSAFKNVAEFVSGIISDFKYDAYMMRYGDTAVYNLENFVRSAAESGEISLSRFLKDISVCTEVTPAPSGGDRVKISTFHGFKGLEAEVVFVADTAAIFSSKSRTGDVIFDGNGYIGLNYFDLEKRTKSETLSHYAVAEKIRERELKEEMRLFYVALTRAKSYMYVTAAISETRMNNFGVYPLVGNASSNLDFISQAMYSGCLNVGAYRHASSVSAEKTTFTVPSFEGGNEAASLEIGNAQAFVYPHKEATGLSMKYSASALGTADDDTSALYKEAADEGTAYHKIMENIDYATDTTDGVKDEIYRMVQEGIISVGAASCVDPAAILKCLSSDVMRLAARSAVFREKKFTMRIPAYETGAGFTSGESLLVQGIVDLIIDGEERYIIDFKNSNLRNEETLKKYKNQLNLYKRAVESAFGGKKFKTALYSFKTGKTVILDDGSQ